MLRWPATADPASASFSAPGGRCPTAAGEELGWTQQGWLKHSLLLGVLMLLFGVKPGD